MTNGKDRLEILHIFEILHFKKQPYNEFHPKNHLKSATTTVNALEK